MGLLRPVAGQLYKHVYGISPHWDLIQQECSNFRYECLWVYSSINRLYSCHIHHYLSSCFVEHFWRWGTPHEIPWSWEYNPQCRKLPITRIKSTVARKMGRDVWSLSSHFTQKTYRSDWLRNACMLLPGSRTYSAQTLHSSCVVTWTVLSKHTNSITTV